MRLLEFAVLHHVPTELEEDILIPSKAQKSRLTTRSMGEAIRFRDDPEGSLSVRVDLTHPR